MPLYTVSSRTTFPETTKQLLAKLIMDVHCEITNAPKTFVNVVFSEGVPLKKRLAYHVLGGVRKGRTNDMNHELQNTLYIEIARLLNTSTQLLELELFEVPASWIMEGGNVLPEPGEEDKCQWLSESHN